MKQSMLILRVAFSLYCRDLNLERAVALNSVFMEAHEFEVHFSFGVPDTKLDCLKGFLGTYFLVEMKHSMLTIDPLKY